MIEAWCLVERVEDTTDRRGRVGPDGVPYVVELKSARFTLVTDGAPQHGRTLGDLLMTRGRRVTLLIEEEADEGARPTVPPKQEAWRDRKSRP